MNITRVALAVDSTQARTASRELDNMSRSGVKAESSVARLGKQLLALGAGAIAVRSVVNQFSAVVREGELLQRNMLRTEQLVQSTGKAAGFTAKQLHEQARALGFATLESTEGIMAAQQILMSFRSVAGDTFTRTTELAADLATVTGTNLNSAMTQLGKVLEDPIRNLSQLNRSGVSFTQTQIDLIKELTETNRKAEAQSMILDVLAGQYGGVARREAEGLAGAQDTLAQAVQEARLAMNDYLGASEMMADVVNSAANSAKSFSEALSNGDLDGKIDAVVKVAEILTALMLGRMAQGLAVVAAGKLSAAAASIRYQSTLATMAGLSTRAAVAQTALGTAVAGARGALALLGGPVGVISLAAGAMYAFREELGLTKPKVDSLVGSLDELTAGFDSLTEAQARHRELELMTQLDQARAVAEEAAKVAKLWETARPTDMGASEWAEKQIESAAAADTAAGAVDRLEKAIVGLWAAQTRPRGSRQTESPIPEPEGIDDSTDAIKRQIAALKIEADTLGVSATAATLYKMSLEGATVAQLAAAQAHLERISASHEENSAYDQAIASADAMLDAIHFETRALSMNNTEREIAIALRRLESLGIKQGTEEYEKYAAAIEAAIVRQNAAAKSLEEKADPFADAWKQAIERVDGLFVDLWESAFSGAKSFMDSLKNTFRRMLAEMAHAALTRPIMISMGFGGVLGAPDTASAAQAGSLQQTMGLDNVVSSVKSLYSTVSGGFASLSSSVTTAAFNLGEWMAYSSSNMMQNAGLAIMDASSTLGTIAASAAAVAGGMVIGSLISGDKSILGEGKGWATTAAGTGIGMALGGPLGAVIGGAVGGLVNSAFGRGPEKVKAQTIEGTIGETTALQHITRTKQKGGWFRSDKRRTYSADVPELERMMGQASQAIMETAGFYAEAIGWSADAASNFTQAIKVNLKGLSEEEQEQAIADSLAGFSVALAEELDQANAVVNQYASEFASIAREGETAADTLARLGSSIIDVNQVFAALNLRLMQSSLAGADAASRMLDMFGGMEQFISSTDFYYQNFYSEQERAEKTTEQLTQALQAMGRAMPATREEYRAMVEQMNQIGEHEMFATLVQLAPAFNQIYTYAEGLIGIGSQVEKINRAFSEFESIGTFTGFGKDQFLEKWSPQLPGIHGEQLDWLFSSKHMDVVPMLMDKYWDASAETIQQFADDYASALDYEARYQQQHNDLRLQLLRATGQEELAILEERAAALAALDPRLRDLQQSLWDAAAATEAAAEAYQATRENVSALSSAVDSLTSARRSMDEVDRQSVLSAIMGLRGVTAGVRSGDLSGLDSISGMLSVLTSDNSALYATATDYQRDQGRAALAMIDLQDAAGQQLTVEERTLSSLEAMIEQEQRQLDALLDIDQSVKSLSSGVPGFSAGSSYIPNDMIAKVHQGEKIIDPASSAILDKYGIKVNGGNNSELIAEVKQMSAEIRQLKGYIRQTTKHTGETRDRLNRWNVEGIPAERVAI